VWRWDQAEPFGVNVPDGNPSGLGAFEFPLRFPGQYADKEDNLTYNYFRDYDPGIGRYINSDPTGLEGGLNTYAYANLNPMTNVDPDGLFVSQALQALMTLGGALIMNQSAQNAQQSASAISPSNVIAFPQLPPKEETKSCPAPGGPNDPCKKMWEALEKMHALLSRQILANTGFLSTERYETLNARRQFNDAVDQFNRYCVPLGWAPYAKKFVVGPQRPSIPGTQTLHDFYGR
jgi:RHS repeat-associated protein